MHIPTHLQRLQEQVPDFTGDSDAYTRSILPKAISLDDLPGARLLRSLRDNAEFELLKYRAGVSFDSEDDDDSWLPEHYLGGGGHGKVGVYRRRDMNGYIVDEIALKDQTGNRRKDEFWYDSGPLGLHRRLMKEAVIQHQLNKKQTESMKNLMVPSKGNVANSEQISSIFETINITTTVSEKKSFRIRVF